MCSYRWQVCAAHHIGQLVYLCSSRWQVCAAHHIGQLVYLCSSRWQVCAACRIGRPRAWHDGLRSFRSIRTDLPTGQLCVRPERCRQQLGEGTLHRGSRAGRQCPRRRPQGGRELRLSTRLPTDTLARWRHRLRHGDASHQQDPRGVPRQDHEHILGRAIAKGMPRWCGAVVYEKFSETSRS